MTIELTEEEREAVLKIVEYAMFEAATITDDEMGEKVTDNPPNWPRIARETAKHWRGVAAVVAKLTGAPAHPDSTFVQIAERYERSADEYERDPMPEMPGHDACNCPGCRAERRARGEEEIQ